MDEFIHTDFQSSFTLTHKDILELTPMPIAWVGKERDRVMYPNEIVLIFWHQGVAWSDFTIGAGIMATNTHILLNSLLYRAGDLVDRLREPDPVYPEDYANISVYIADGDDVYGIQPASIDDEIPPGATVHVHIDDRQLAVELNETLVELMYPYTRLSSLN